MLIFLFSRWGTHSRFQAVGELLPTGKFFEGCLIEINLTERGLLLMKDIIIDCVAVLISECSIERKQAAILLLKHYLPHKFLKFLLEDENLYPFDRNDVRVKAWTKQIVSKGQCEKCGSSERLEAHHIIKWADYPKGRIDLQNGMCLCHKCHTQEHEFDNSYYMMKAR